MRRKDTGRQGWLGLRTFLWALAALAGCSEARQGGPAEVGSVRGDPVVSGAAEEGRPEMRKETPKEKEVRKEEPGSGQKLVLTEEEWRKKLDPQAYRVLRQKGTERAFTGEYWNTKTEGVYACAACGQELFGSETKFDSGTGWPSFWAPLRDQSLRTEDDSSFFSTRTEVLCSRCDSHLGHVFDDGPAPTGLRYCINSVALRLDERKKEGRTTEAPPSPSAK